MDRETKRQIKELEKWLYENNDRPRQQGSSLSIPENCERVIAFQKIAKNDKKDNKRVSFDLV